MLTDFASGFGLGAALGIGGAVLLSIGALSYAFFRSLTVTGWCLIIGLTVLLLSYL